MKSSLLGCALLSTFSRPPYKIITVQGNPLLNSSTVLLNTSQSLAMNSNHIQISQPDAQFCNTSLNPEMVVDANSPGSGESTHHKKGSIVSLATAWLHHPVQNHMEKRDADANMPGLLGSEQLRTNAHIAHGTVMGVAVVLFFPLGGMMMKIFKFPGLVWIHAAVEMVGMLVLITGFALGIWLSILHNEVCQYLTRYLRSLRTILMTDAVIISLSLAMIA